MEVQFLVVTHWQWRTELALKNRDSTLDEIGRRFLRCIAASKELCMKLDT